MANSLFALLLATLLSAAALAQPAGNPLPDGAQEARAKALFYQIRCVVCAAESIADSPADVAGDMRRLIREQIAAGKSDDAITAGLAARYGDVILMRPPLMRATWLLWFGPLLMLAAAALLAMRYFRSRTP